MHWIRSTNDGHGPPSARFSTDTGHVRAGGMIAKQGTGKVNERTLGLAAIRRDYGAGASVDQYS